ncbi:protein O-linked-mannose beta-1,2-N-acetylglucosaminyltransferase 1-like isoform X2 [Ischnura elegans]|uniref:protein O-linked-mannose beta-1,2-N-acetylglucosaminyltransferase 1-like isoform X2 n=1 Tax=Ischnura elegans TaxID=197161 RepID=UPI001ED876D5|nr:protein O-linked-mannose beta-1,2-N-acetylglucosaminyltransferase 1-like isoform X2 [Ischnura elegans]
MQFSKFFRDRTPESLGEGGSILSPSQGPPITPDHPWSLPLLMKDLRFKAKRHFQEIIEIGEILPNCGLPQTCPDDSFPVHLYTGQDKDDQPRLCVLGKYIIGSDINGGGRGLNVAIIEPVHFQVVSVQNFDTYNKDGGDFEAFLLNEVLMDDIIILFTFDEASKELDSNSKKLLYELGSGKIQNLHYRSQWYMISQKGIKGYTVYEKLNFAKSNKWAEVIDEKFCIPAKIPSQIISPDPFPRENTERVAFCQQFNKMEYEAFCEATAQHEPILPTLLTNRSLIASKAFSTPVVILSCSSPSSLLLTLESLIHQPGIHPPNVFILHCAGQTEISKMAHLFGFQVVEMNDTFNYGVESAFKLIKKSFPLEKNVIILEEGQILSPDFLFFMAQMIPVLERDNSLLGVSSWNPNGYVGFSSDPHSAFRVEEFPGIAFLVPIRVYDNYLEGRFNACCTKLAWRGWDTIVQESGGNMIVPDLSRVLHRPLDVMVQTMDNSNFTFIKQRLTNIDASAWIERPQDLLQDKYFQHMAEMMQMSTPLHLSSEDLEKCEQQENLAALTMLKECTGKVFAVYFIENQSSSYKKLETLCSCFGLKNSQFNSKPRGLYKNILRFSINSNTVLLVESTSPFYKTRPLTLEPL